MHPLLLLNNKEISITFKDLPYLIHGNEKSGASYFTTSLAADLFNKGHKIIFLHGYPMAEQQFILQIAQPETITHVNDESTLSLLSSKRALLIQRDDKLFLKILEALPDTNNRIIIIKNVELYSEKVLSSIMQRNNIILSGNIDNASIKGLLNEKTWSTRTFFSDCLSLNHQLPVSSMKYLGYTKGNNLNGVLSVNQ